MCVYIMYNIYIIYIYIHMFNMYCNLYRYMVCFTYIHMIFCSLDSCSPSQAAVCPILKILAKLRLQTTMQQHCSLHLLTAQRDAHAPTRAESSESRSGKGVESSSHQQTRPEPTSYQIVGTSIIYLLLSCAFQKGKNYWFQQEREMRTGHSCILASGAQTCHK